MLLIVLLALGLVNASNIVHLADNRLVSVSDTSYSLLSSPPAGSRVVSHGGGGIVLAFHPQDRDASLSSCPEKLQVSKYGNTSDTWDPIVSSSLIPFNSTVWDQTADSVYLFGGVDCSGHYSSQLYAFNVTASEFYMPQNIHPPTELVHGSAVRLNGEREQAVLVGGKAPDGWIGMNQVAVFDNGAWSFKSIGDASKVDARASPRLLYLSDDRLLIFGGSVAGRDPKPYLVELDVGNWSWKEVPVKLDEQPLGATVIGDKLIVVNDADSNKKRSWFMRRRRDTQGGLSFQTFDSNSWDSLDLDISESSPPNGRQNEHGDHDSDESNDNDSKTNSNKHETVTKKTSESSSTSETATTATTSTASSTTSSTSTPSSTASASSSSMSTGEIAALSTVLPVSVVSAAAAAVFFIRRSRKQKYSERRNLTLSPMSFDQSDGAAAASAETASIDSWNAKREMYEKQPSNANRLSFPGSVSSAATVTRRKVSQQQPPPPDDDSKTIYNNDDDNNEDELFRNRDVQVLVSSVRRSKLVVTNPDTNTNSDDENDSNN